MSLDFLKSFVRDRLRAQGLQLVPMAEPPELLSDPLEALQQHRKGKDVGFLCPIRDCLMYNGLRFEPSGYHPFIETLQEHQEGYVQSYEGSALQRYYTGWQPSNAREALIGCPDGPEALTDVPSYAFFLPWLFVNPEQRAEMVWKGIQAFYEGNGLEIDTDHGYLMHGPVSEAFGMLEYQRLLEVYHALRSEGYDRTHGDIVVSLYRRGDELRFGVEHGNHRIAAMAALGHDTIPASFISMRVVDVKDAAHWPQVRNGFWPEASARRYFHHLFDFDAQVWAEDRGLVAASQTLRPSSISAS